MSPVASVTLTVAIFLLSYAALRLARGSWRVLSGAFLFGFWLISYDLYLGTSAPGEIVATAKSFAWLLPLLIWPATALRTIVIGPGPVRHFARYFAVCGLLAPFSETPFVSAYSALLALATITAIGYVCRSLPEERLLQVLTASISLWCLLALSLEGAHALGLVSLRDSAELFDGVRRFLGISLHQNSLGSLAASLVLLSWTVGRTPRKIFDPRLPALVGVVTLLLSGQRTGLLALVVSAAIAVLFYRHRAGRVVGLGLALGLVAYVVAAGPSPDQSLIVGGRGTTSVEQRVEIWQSAERLATQRPMLGYGLAASKSVLEEEVARGPTGLDGVTHAHSLVWQTLLDLGLLGALFVAAGVISTLRAAAVSPKSRNRGFMGLIILPLVSGVGESTLGIGQPYASTVVFFCVVSLLGFPMTDGQPSRADEGRILQPWIDTQGGMGGPPRKEGSWGTDD